MRDAELCPNFEVFMLARLSVAEFDQPLRLKAVCAMVSMSRSWVLAAVARGAFPPPAYRLGGRRAVAWSLLDITRWLESQRIPRAN